MTVSRSSQGLVYGLVASSSMSQCHTECYIQGCQEGGDLFCNSAAKAASDLSLKPLKCSREGQHGKSLGRCMDRYPNTWTVMEFYQKPVGPYD